MVREHNLWNVASWQRVRKRRVCKEKGISNWGNRQQTGTLGRNQKEMRSGDTVLGSIWWDRPQTSPEGTAIITMGGYNGTHTQEFFFLTSLFCLMVSIGNPVFSG